MNLWIWLIILFSCHFLSPRADLHVVEMLRLCLWHKPTELAHSFLLYSCVYFCLYGLFNYISFHKFSRQLSAFSLFFESCFCPTGPFNYISLYESLSQLWYNPLWLTGHKALCGWLGIKHQLTLFLCVSDAFRAANHYALGVIYHAQVDCITLLRPWWHHFERRKKKREREREKKRENKMVIFMPIRACVRGEEESPSTTGIFLWLCHSQSAFAFSKKRANRSAFFHFPELN